jgi:hypothetical protein
LPVSYTIDGDPDRVPTGVAVCAYRIVQGALSNIVRHCRCNCGSQSPRWTWPSRTRRRNARRPKLRQPTAEGWRGCVKRVAVFDGKLETGPRPDGGFAVHAILPLERR